MNPTPPPNDAALETWLRRDADVPLPDDGFSKRVLAALPRRSAYASVWAKGWPAGLGALVGLILVVLIDQNGSGTGPIVSTANQITAILTDPGALLTLGICAALATGSLVIGDLLED